MQEAIRTLLGEFETWAIVGCSPDPRRDSHRIAGLLQSRGKRVIPVNPAASEILGERAYASLHDLPEDVRVDERAEVGGVLEALQAGLPRTLDQRLDLGAILELAEPQSLLASDERCHLRRRLAGASDGHPISAGYARWTTSGA